MEYIDGYYFNKAVFVQFNSSVGWFTGYTPYGMRSADLWNKDKPLVQKERDQVDSYCKASARSETSALLSRAVPPKVKVTSVNQAAGSRDAILMCSAYRFYPQTISVSWLRDGQPVTSDVTTTEELADGDWYYQIHSHLEYTHKPGEKISCVVEHASFNQPMVYDWDPSLPESERNKVAIGASGLVLGIILSAAGFIYYKKKSSS
ncbi:SLA class II histocompatibility antigen, DQ haplotype C beta chain-like isoform X2 [Brachyhypopomus gauderio]